MRTLTKTQVLRLVNALTKLNVKQLNRLYKGKYIPIVEFKWKCIGFTGESFEQGLVAVYEGTSSYYKTKQYLLVKWNGKTYNVWKD